MVAHKCIKANLSVLISVPIKCLAERKRSSRGKERKKRVREEKRF